MATDVNKSTRKRKSDFYFNFEVSEADCSPSNSPEPPAKTLACTISEARECETSTEVDVKEIVVHDKEKIQVTCEMTDSEIQIRNKSLPDGDKSSTIAKQKVSTTSINIKPDVSQCKSDDLRCMDMEVDEALHFNRKQPFVSLTFHDTEFAHMYKSSIINFIKELVDFDLEDELECNAKETKVVLWEIELNDELVDGPESKNDLFVVDTTPSRHCENLPKYSANRAVIDDVKKTEVVENSANYRNQSNCFNCDGNHSMRDCKEVKDYRRISLARNKYMSSSQVKSIRYHLDDDQKYKHLVPGKLSEKLRKALDLRKNECPAHIYRMRTFGYPPGWLQEAMTSEDNTLELFDFQGCAVENGKEDANKALDLAKVIDYPGFNVPLEKGMKDDFKKYNRCPPYSDEQSKEIMIQYVENCIQFQKQQELLEQTNKYPSINYKSQKLEESDNNSREHVATIATETRPKSPTLTDLEMRKRQLLAELEDGGSSCNSPQTSDNLDKSTTEPSTSVSEITVSPNVMSSTFGTPILKTGSPFSRLPDPDKFSKDISQVINFENLPNYTGKYETMVKVINKVRDIKKS